MKILMLIDSMNVGGAETHVETLSGELANMGHSVTLASAGGKICKRMARDKIKLVLLPPITPSAEKTVKNSLICRIFTARKILSRLIKKEKPDVVHAHTRRTALLSHAICKALKIPLIVSAHAMLSMKFPKNLLSVWGDGTIAVSEDIKKHLALHGAPVKSIEVIFNGVKLPKGENEKCEK